MVCGRRLPFSISTFVVSSLAEYERRLKAAFRHVQVCRFLLHCVWLVASGLPEPPVCVVARFGAPGGRPTAIVSAHLHDGGGLNQDDREVLAKIAKAMEEWGLEGQYIIGDDFTSRRAQLNSQAFWKR